MNFTELPIEGAYLLDLAPKHDARGSFARAFCVKEFSALNLETSFVQANLSYNNSPGIIRGMHFQKSAHAEVKLIRCVAGAIYDVIVDLRPESKTYLHWFGTELSDLNGKAMYVPRGCAHGYQSLTESSTAHYLVSSFYEPKAEGGCRYNDPKVGIKWPLSKPIVSEKDLSWPFL
jgi:dTDP-4-dehydrorhamnose 3,5-epimerase